MGSSGGDDGLQVAHGESSVWRKLSDSVVRPLDALPALVQRFSVSRTRRHDVAQLGEQRVARPGDRAFAGDVQAICGSSPWRARR